MTKKAFTLVEILVVIAIIAILVTVVYLALSPQLRFNEAQSTTAVSELGEFAKALNLYAIDHGSYPVDSGSILPDEAEKYISKVADWPNGPFPGSVYSYDNNTSKTCANSNASESIQISLKNVPGRNPDSTNNWVWYYVIQGKGAPSCDNIAQKGECVNCSGFNL